MCINVAAGEIEAAVSAAAGYLHSAPVEELPETFDYRGPDPASPLTTFMNARGEEIERRWPEFFRRFQSWLGAQADAWRGVASARR